MTVRGAKQVVLFHNTACTINKRIAEWIANRGRRTGNHSGPVFVMPAGLEVEPQSVHVTVRGAKQVVLFHNTACTTDKCIAEWIANRRRRTGNHSGPVLVMPPGLEVEPQSVYVTVRCAEKMVLFYEPCGTVHECVSEWVGYRSGGSGNNR